MIAWLVDAIRRDPYPLYRVARTVTPVLREPWRGIWLLFDYDSARRALTDPETFGSRAAPPAGAPLDWMIFLDPPAHTKLRVLVARAFTPRAIADLEPRVRRLATELLTSGAERGEMDVTADFSAPLPLRLIAEMLGVADEDPAKLARWAEAILGLSDAMFGGERGVRAKRAFAAARDEMRTSLLGWVAERRAAPRADLLTRLLEAEVDGEALTDDEILSFFELLLLAGSETTTNLIGNAILCLQRHPEQLALLRREPERLPAAIEEVLRFRSPVQMVFRTARRGVELRGRRIPEGSLVLPMIGAANRDPRRFPDPDRFDIARPQLSHVGFGHGIHFCLGAALARMEARVALSCFLEVVRCWAPVGGAAWMPRRALNVHGPARLPIRLVGR